MNQHGANEAAGGVDRRADANPPDSPDRFRLMCETLPGIVFRTDADGRWEYVNQRFYEVTGRPRGSALGEGWALALHPDDVISQRERWLRASGGEFEGQCRLGTPSGLYRWYMVRARAVRAPDGHVGHWIGAATDIHDLRAGGATAEEIRERAAELEERAVDLARSNAALEAFAREVAHDIREPLRSIRLITDFLAEDSPGMDATTAARLAKLGDLAVRAQELVSALLEHTRVGHADLRRADQDLAGIVADAVRTLPDSPAESGGEVEVVGPLPVVSCDRVLIGRVFTNLIANGLRYNRSARKLVQIGAADAESGAPTIFVRDNGIGIDLRRPDTIFRIFTRLHPRGEFGGGVGAGLAIARRIVERHGGRIWAESEPGRGTTFRFTLPRGAA